MVPKKIHQIVGCKPSEIVLRSLSSWIQLESFGYKIIYWNDETLGRFVKKNYPYAYQAFISARNHAEAADIARYLLIYHFGGYYVDWDIHLNNIDLFLELCKREQNGYLVIDPENDTLASEHFSAVKKELYLLRIVDDIIDTFHRKERELMFTPKYSGPHRMKNSLERHKYTTQTKISVKDVFEFSYGEIRNQKEFLKSGIMTHFWEHSWIV